MKSSEPPAILYLAIGFLALTALLGSGLAIGCALNAANAERRDNIASMVGAEFTLGGQKAKVLGPFSGSVNISLENADGSIGNLLVDYETVAKAVRGVNQ